MKINYRLPEPVLANTWIKEDEHIIIGEDRTSALLIPVNLLRK